MKTVFIKYMTVVLLFEVLSSAQSLPKYKTVLNSETVKSDTIFLWNGKNLDGLKLILNKANPKVESPYFVKEGVIHFFDTQVGYFLTDEIFENYVLHAEWRWPEKNEKGNSGILLDVQLPDTVWPQCIQVQLKQQNAGDFIAMNGAKIINDGKIYSETIKKINDPSEKPEGDWNEADIICKGNSIEVMINGCLQNKGEKVNLNKGRIGFQLEGKSIEFRNIFLVKL